MNKPKTSRVLGLAKNMLKNGKHEYICCAYSDAWSELTGEDYDTELPFRNEIQRRLDYGLNTTYNDYPTWLRRVHGITHESVGNSYFRKLKEARINWVNNLIEEYKRKGD